MLPLMTAGTVLAWSLFVLAALIAVALLGALVRVLVERAKAAAGAEEAELDGDQARDDQIQDDKNQDDND